MSWSFSDSIYSDLIASRELIYNPCRFKYSELIVERESSEYGACIFKIHSIYVRFQVAKITPTKIGQFIQRKYLSIAEENGAAVITRLIKLCHHTLGL